MADEINKKLSEYLNLNLDRDWNEVKADLDKTYIKIDTDKPLNTVLLIESQHPELHKSILGKYSGSTKAQLKKLANEIGVELTWAELEDAKSAEVLEKMIELTTEKVTGYQSQLSELEAKVKEAQKSGASAKDIEAAQKQVDEWKQKFEDTNQLLETTKTEFTTFKQEKENAEKSFKINHFKNEAYNGIKLKTSSDYEHKGFIQDIENKYQLELEGDEVVVRNREGQRVPNPEKHGSFMSYADVVKLEAAQAKLLDENPHSGKQIVPPPVAPRTETKPKPTVILHPSLRK